MSKGCTTGPQLLCQPVPQRPYQLTHFTSAQIPQADAVGVRPVGPETSCLASVWALTKPSSRSRTSGTELILKILMTTKLKPGQTRIETVDWMATVGIENGYRVDEKNHLPGPSVWGIQWRSTSSVGTRRVFHWRPRHKGAGPGPSKTSSDGLN